MHPLLEPRAFALAGGLAGQERLRTITQPVRSHILGSSNLLVGSIAGGLGIPAGSTIDSITLSVEARTQAGKAVTVSSVYTVVDGTPDTGTNFSAGSSLTASDALYDLAASGLELDALNGEFGVAVGFSNDTGDEATAQVFVDRLGVTVAYTAPSGGAGWRSRDWREWRSWR